MNDVLRLFNLIYFLFNQFRKENFLLEKNHESLLNETDLLLLEKAPEKVKDITLNFLKRLRMHFPNGEFNEIPVGKTNIVLQKNPNNFVGIKYHKTRSYIDIISWGDHLQLCKDTDLYWRDCHSRYGFIVCSLENEEQLNSIFYGIKKAYELQNETKKNKPTHPWIDIGTNEITVSKIETNLNNTKSREDFLTELFSRIRFEFDPNQNTIVKNEGKLEDLKNPKDKQKKRNPDFRSKKLKSEKDIRCKTCGIKLEKHLGRAIAINTTHTHHKKEFHELPDSGVDIDVKLDGESECVFCHNYYHMLMSTFGKIITKEEAIQETIRVSKLLHKSELFE